MTRSSKIHYFLLISALMLLLTGCELAREGSEMADTSPLEALPPTLAPLGVEESALVEEATAVPTVLSVQPTATASDLAASEAPANAVELVAPTAQPPSVPAEPAAENTVAEEEPVAAESAPAPSIIADATTPEELPEGGPIAANPPVSETDPIIPAASSGGSYIVQAGDTLFSISQRYGTSVEAIVSANGLNSDLVQIGQTLTIPTEGDTYSPPVYEPVAPGGPEGFYVVGPNDTLFSIAMRYGTTVEAIANANNIAYPFIIHAGQTLTIPGYDTTYPAPGYAPDQGYPQQPPVDGYYQQPDQGYYPQQPPVDGYYQQPGQGYYPQQPPAEGYYPPDQGYYPQQPPVDGYYPQPGQGYYPQQPPAEGYYQPDQGYYPQQPPADGYYPQPGQGYPQQPPADGYYPQPGQDGGYYPAPGYGAPSMPGGAGTHTVAPGETLYSIARRYGVPPEAIAAANGLANPNQIFVGQVLYLP
jgi:LysM repeat protein